MAIVPSSLFPTKTTAPSAAYPQGGAQNITAPGDGTGTPWDQAIVNDLFGLQQWLLAKASIVPSGSADTAVVSDYGDALTALFGNIKLTVLLATDVAWIPDPLTTAIEFTIVGGGGGAGGVLTSAGAGQSGAGAGGATAIAASNVVDATYNVTVGGAGVGGTPGNAGASGGTSSVVSASINASAGGGSAGAGMTATAGSAVTLPAAGGMFSGTPVGNDGGEGGGGMVWVGVPVAWPISGTSVNGGGISSRLDASAGGVVHGAGGGSATSAGSFSGGSGATGLVLIKEYL